MTLYDQFDYEKARANFERAVELDPEFAQARIYFRRASALLKVVDSEVQVTAETLSQLRSVKIEQKKSELERVYNAGHRLYQSGEYEGAIEHFELALEIIRWFPYKIATDETRRNAERYIVEAKKNLGWQRIREEQESLRAAVSEVEREEADRVQRERGRVSELLVRVEQAIRLEQFERALDLCEQVLDRDPNNSNAKRLQEVASDGKVMKYAHRTFVDKEEHYKRLQDYFEDVEVPYQELVYWPTKERWLELSNRPEGIQQDIEDDPEEVQQLKRILDTRKVNLEFEDQPLSNVIGFLQDMMRLNITIDPNAGVADELLTLHLRDVLLRDALKIICEQIGMTYVFRDNIILITEKGREHGEGILEIYNVTDILAKNSNFEGPDIEMFDPEAAGGGLGFGDAFEEDEPWLDGEALIELIEGATGEDAWPALESGFGTITYHRGQLVVINSRDVHRQIRRILYNIRMNSDIFVVMEARFVEVFDDFLRDIGVDIRGLGSDFGEPFTIDARPERGGTDAGWVFDRDPNNTLAGRNQNVFDGYPDAFITGNRMVGDPAHGGFMRVTWLDEFQVSAMIHAKQEKADRRTLTSAMITAANMQRVYVSVIAERAYIADYEMAGTWLGQDTAEIGDPVIANFQEGVVLDVRPVVSADRKYITIDVKPTVSRLISLTDIPVVLGTLNVGVAGGPIQLPNLHLQRAFTTVTVPDGGTVMLGGLQTQNWKKYTSGVPILSSIPILNLLFSRTGEVEEKEQLVILLTARLLLLRDVEREKFGTSGAPE